MWTCHPSKQGPTLVFSVLLAAASTVSPLSGQEPSGLADAVISIASRKTGLSPDELRISSLTSIKFEYSGQEVYRAFLEDAAGTPALLVVTNAEGYEVDMEGVRQKEETAYHSLFGKKSFGLVEQLKKLSTSDEIDLSVWLRMDEWEIPDWRPDPTSLDRLSETELDLYAQNADVGLAAAIADIQAPVLAELAADGLKITAVDQYSPLIFLRGRVDAIPKIEAIDRVMLVYEDDQFLPATNSPLAAESKSFTSPLSPIAPVEPPINISTSTIGAPDVWALGYTGFGEKVALIEAQESLTNGSNIDFANVWLSSSNGGTYNGALPKSSHATRVAGIITSDSSGHRGVAHGVQLLSGGLNGPSLSTSTVTPVLNWAVNQLARLFNHSYGGGAGADLQASDIQLDYYARNQGRFFAVSSGNVDPLAKCGPPITDLTPIQSPGRGYNVLSVGAINDRNTVSWSDDIMFKCSAYGNPNIPGGSTPSDREKPEVVAPGVKIQSTTLGSAGWVSDSLSTTGTSFSAPHVSGLAALLIDRQPFFKTWPEVLRAAIIAGALNNVDLPNSGAQNRRLSKQDGAGSIDARGAYTVIDGGRYAFGTWTPADFPTPGACGKIYPISNVAVGKRIKAALVWNSNPSSGYTTDPLNARFNLLLANQSGQIPASKGGVGSSFYNSWETIDYIAETAGSYHLCVVREQFDSSSERFAVAWFRGFVGE